MPKLIFFILIACLIGACKKKDMSEHPSSATPDLTITGNLWVWDTLIFTSNVPYDNVKMDFGDGSYTMNDTAKHIYNKPGTYTVRMIINNDTAQAISKTITIKYNITFAGDMRGTRLYSRAYSYFYSDNNIDESWTSDVSISIDVISDSLIIVGADTVNGNQSRFNFNIDFHLDAKGTTYSYSNHSTLGSQTHYECNLQYNPTTNTISFHRLWYIPSSGKYNPWDPYETATYTQK